MSRCQPTRWGGTALRHQGARSAVLGSHQDGWSVHTFRGMITLVCAQAHLPSIRLSNCGYAPISLCYRGAKYGCTRRTPCVLASLSGMYIAHREVCVHVLQIPSKSLRPRRARLIRGPSGPTAAVLATEKPPPAAAADRNGTGRRVMIIGEQWNTTMPHHHKGVGACVPNVKELMHGHAKLLRQAHLGW